MWSASHVTRKPSRGSQRLFVEHATNSALLKVCYLFKAKAAIYCLHNLTWCQKWLRSRTIRQLSLTHFPLLFFVLFTRLPGWADTRGTLIIVSRPFENSRTLSCNGCSFTLVTRVFFCPLARVNPYARITLSLLVNKISFSLNLRVFWQKFHQWCTLSVENNSYKNK